MELKNVKESEIRIIHVQQDADWDCGLACVKMILKSFNKNLDDFQVVCDSFGLDTSIWTVDLVCILQKYGIKHLFVTKTLGVDASYSDKPFYKDSYGQDVIRVQRAFECADTLGLHIQQRSVEMSEIVGHLKSGQPIIMLVDWNIMRCLHNSVQCGDCFCGFWRKVQTYQGHYVVLTGCNESGTDIHYLNPERSSACSVNVSVLEESRKAHGTDEDMIFIFADSPQIQNKV